MYIGCPGFIEKYAAPQEIAAALQLFRRHQLDKSLNDGLKNQRRIANIGKCYVMTFVGEFFQRLTLAGLLEFCGMVQMY